MTIRNQLIAVVVLVPLMTRDDNCRNEYVMHEYLLKLPGRQNKKMDHCDVHAG